MVAGGGCWGLGFFFLFLNAFSSFKARWFGASPALTDNSGCAKASHETALISAHSRISVASEGFAGYGAVVQPWETLWLPKSGGKIRAFLATFLGSQVKLEHKLGQHRSHRVKGSKNSQKLLLQGSRKKKPMDLAQAR